LIKILYGKFIKFYLIVQNLNLFLEMAWILGDEATDLHIALGSILDQIIETDEGE